MPRVIFFSDMNHTGYEKDNADRKGWFPSTCVYTPGVYAISDTVAVHTTWAEPQNDQGYLVLYHTRLNEDEAVKTFLFDRMLIPMQAYWSLNLKRQQMHQIFNFV